MYFPEELVREIMSYLQVCRLCMTTFIDNTFLYDHCNSFGKSCVFSFLIRGEDEEPEANPICEDCLSNLITYTYDGPKCMSCFETWVQFTF